jgi:hypothetical protein
MDLKTLEQEIENASDEDLQRILAQLQMLEDFPAYSKRILKVQTMRGKIVPFELNKPQQILHNIIEKHIRPKRLIRIVALKARRMGFSTYFSGRFYQNTSSQPNRYAIQITHEPDATDFLFKMVKRFYNMSPDEYRPSTMYNNTKLLEFNTRKGDGLNSAFRVATAGKDDVASGQLVHYCHLSEVAKWAPHNTHDLLTSIMPCIPDDPDTAVVFESTAKGIGGEFYDRFWDAKYRIWVSKLDNDGNPVISESINEKASEDDIYTSIFLPWFCFDEYQMRIPVAFTLSKEEIEIKNKHNLSMEQMAWRRWTIANKCKNNVDVFNQEYPDTPRAAFLGTGRPVFDNMKVLELMEAAPEPVARYEFHAGNWSVNDKGRLKVWEEPRSGEAYIISADVAEGLRDGDYSCADVINHRTGQQVAQWHGHLDADNIHEFADVLAGLGRRYNVALLVPERNNHGLAVVTQLYHEGYPNLYVETVPDPPGKPRKRYGWVTSRSTRPLIIDNLISEMTEGSHGIVCAETFDEMLSFKRQDNGKMEADLNRFDDRVLCIAIGKYVRQITDLPAQRRPRHEKALRTGTRRKRISPRAWT